jgi:hypothetical protein
MDLNILTIAGFVLLAAGLVIGFLSPDQSPSRLSYLLGLPGLVALACAQGYSFYKSRRQ